MEDALAAVRASLMHLSRENTAQMMARLRQGEEPAPLPPDHHHHHDDDDTRKDCSGSGHTLPHPAAASRHPRSPTTSTPPLLDTFRFCETPEKVVGQVQEARRTPGFTLTSCGSGYGTLTSSTSLHPVEGRSPVWAPPSLPFRQPAAHCDTDRDHAVSRPATLRDPRVCSGSSAPRPGRRPTSGSFVSTGTRRSGRYGSLAGTLLGSVGGGDGAQRAAVTHHVGLAEAMVNTARRMSVADRVEKVRREEELLRGSANRVRRPSTLLSAAAHTSLDTSAHGARLTLRSGSAGGDEDAHERAALEYREGGGYPYPLLQLPAAAAGGAAVEGRPPSTRQRDSGFVRRVRGSVSAAAEESGGVGGRAVGGGRPPVTPSVRPAGSAGPTRAAPHRPPSPTSATPQLPHKLLTEAFYASRLSGVMAQEAYLHFVAEAQGREGGRRERRDGPARGRRSSTQRRAASLAESEPEGRLRRELRQLEQQYLLAMLRERESPSGLDVSATTTATAESASAYPLLWVAQDGGGAGAGPWPPIERVHWPPASTGLAQSRPTPAPAKPRRVTPPQARAPNGGGPPCPPSPRTLSNLSTTAEPVCGGRATAREGRGAVDALTAPPLTAADRIQELMRESYKLYEASHTA